ncbi:HNH endonuclease signature motif containing protein [Mycobacterium sp. E740]|uniref:HNH endonuclease signature motif containing protein n=1 Tax=Mycobacterium sp. E740 TaxID=1834149 RepID=UPI0007FC23DA|nr:HNH endonuclease signature motif containing protein [Mycobacterium sp. E740]OBI84377.1 HNH endonuclease [Mycobacterium sp. E740]
MFDDLVAAAGGTRGAAAVGAWARVENAACARRLDAGADVLERLLAEAGSVDREQWCMDNWTMAAAEVAAAQGVSLGVASHQLLIADNLRQRLPRVAEVFAAGAISYRMVAAVVTRTRLIGDPEAMAKVDTELAAHIGGWGSLSVQKLQNEIDYWVDRYDPAAVRRTELSARGRFVDVHDPKDGSGTASVEAWLFAADAAALDARLDAMAAAVCEHDPRTADQRRSDALGALGNGADRLQCACAREDCDAAAATPSAVVIHVVAREESLTDDTPAHLDGKAPRPEGEPTGRAATDPAFLMGRGLLPAPLLAAKLAGTAKLQYIRHPGDGAPEPRYIPSAALAWFVRCRDLRCRFPGCDEPAANCDIDHTIAYPAGPTQASNLKCLCRKHHLLKTFGGWLDEQRPDGTVIWTSRHGQRITTHPGSRLLFPTLCRPTAPAMVRTDLARQTSVARGLKMPRRKATRAENRARAISEERRHNEAYAAERNKPPPF